MFMIQTFLAETITAAFQHWLSIRADPICGTVKQQYKYFIPGWYALGFGIGFNMQVKAIHNIRSIQGFSTVEIKLLPFPNRYTKQFNTYKYFWQWTTSILKIQSLQEGHLYLSLYPVSLLTTLNLNSISFWKFYGKLSKLSYKKKKRCGKTLFTLTIKLKVQLKQKL